MPVHKKYNRNVKTNALGRGLDALISTESVSTQGSSTINEVPLQQIEANPNQPRREFDPVALEELASSIRQLGIVQPITLRQVDHDRFQIIAGERRWRASQLAGLTTIPAYIRTIKDENVMEMALVENIQREDLNAIEIALAYEHLLEKSAMTQEKVAERVGKSRPAIANYLRLLKLPAQVQMALQKKEIDMGHARALLSLDSPSLQLKVFREIQKNDYTVRRVEEVCKQLKNGEDVQSAKKTIAATRRLPEEYNILKDQLSQLFDTKVQMSCNDKGKGKISIPFASEEELEHIMSVLDSIGKGDVLAVAQVAGPDTIRVVYPDDTVAVRLHSTDPADPTLQSLWEADVAPTLSKAQTKGKEKRQRRDWSQWRPEAKRAMWLALVLPGAGQVYNRKYWKLPIIYGGFAGCIYAMTWNNQMYHDYSQAYLDIMDDDPTTESYKNFLHLGTEIRGLVAARGARRDGQ